MSRISRVCQRITFLLLTFLPSATCVLSQEPAFRISVNASLLPLNVIVRDSNGRSVLDLKQDDFEIYEDGAPKAIGYFTVADAPRSTMLIFDRSESVENQDPFMLQAINVFSRTLRPGDRISVFSFARELEVRLKWQSIVAGQPPSVKLPPTQPWSAVYDALEKAGKRFDNEKGRRGIIILTDGDDSDFFGETRRLGGVLDIPKDSNFQGLLQKLRKQNIPIYFVALKTNPYGEFAYLNGAEYRKSRDYALSELRSATVGEDFVLGARRRIEAIAEATGGHVLVPAGLTDVASFYERIARELGESYSLGYEPGNVEPGGKYRRIEVRVRRPDLDITQSRDGFQP